MSIYPKKELREQFNDQIEKLDRLISDLEEASTRFSYVRGAYFVISVFALYAVAQTGSDGIFFSSLLALSGGFIYLVSRHKKITDHRDQLSFLKEVKNQQVGRMDLQWEKLPEYSFERDLSDHAYSNDLHITGEFSVHHLMDTSIYEGSSNRLADWLLNDVPDTEEAKKRHRLVQELMPLTSFRDRLQVQAFISRKEESDKDWSLDKLLKWMREPREVKFGFSLAVLSLLSISNIVLLITAISGITGPWVLITFLTYLGYYNFNSHKISGLFDAGYQIDKQMDRFGKILLYIEQYRFSKGSNLEDFLSNFQNEDDLPSYYLKKASRLAGAASLQTNQVLWPLVNMVIPWDMYFSMKMEDLKKELEPKLTEWLNDFYELEALNSMANFGYLNPGYCFPDFDPSGDVIFEAKDLGHPLIHYSERVTNDFTVKKGDDLFLITGSNMAGKSTFLRTVGVNLVLSFAGAPVNASYFSTREFRVFTSINVKDSLEGGLSHFYAEVRRLRKLLDELEGDHSIPLFFFVDEIFKGTNNRERFKGSTAFLKNVAGKNGIGMVSTHDLELASLENEITGLSNWHFAETIENGKMHFEYKIKEGPCPTTNALKIMQMEGLPIE